MNNETNEVSRKNTAEAISEGKPSVLKVINSTTQRDTISDIGELERYRRSAAQVRTDYTSDGYKKALAERVRRGCVTAESAGTIALSREQLIDMLNYSAMEAPPVLYWTVFSEATPTALEQMTNEQMLELVKQRSRLLNVSNVSGMY